MSIMLDSPFPDLDNGELSPPAIDFGPGNSCEHHEWIGHCLGEETPKGLRCGQGQGISRLELKTDRMNRQESLIINPSHRIRYHCHRIRPNGLSAGVPLLVESDVALATRTPSRWVCRIDTLQW